MSVPQVPVRPVSLPGLAALLLLPGALFAPSPGQESPNQESGDSVLRLSLGEALDIALGNDLGLQIEEQSTDVARYTYKGSWGAFDPVLTASAGFTDSEFEASSSFSGTPVIEESTINASTGLDLPTTWGGSFEIDFSTSNTESNNSLAQGLSVATTDRITVAYNQPLLNGFGRRYATSVQRERDLDYLKQLERFRQSRQELLQLVENSYWDLVAAIGQLATAEATLELGRKQLDQNQRRLEAGVGTEVEVLQAEANVATQIEQRLLRDVAVKAAVDNLKSMLFPGTSSEVWEAELQPVTDLPEVSTADVAPWSAALVVALAQRAELRQQRFEIDASQERLARSVSERRANLDLRLASSSRGYDGDSGTALTDAASWDFPSNSATLTFSLPLGNRTARYAERSARAGVRTARLVYDQLESQIVAEVRRAVRQILYTAEAVTAAQASRGLAERQLAAEEARYREGLSTNFQVLEFQEQLARARFSYTRTRAEFAKARAALLKAQGILGEGGR